MTKLLKYFWYTRYRLALQNKIWFKGLRSFSCTLASTPADDKEWILVYKDLYSSLTMSQKEKDKCKVSERFLL